MCWLLISLRLGWVEEIDDGCLWRVVIFKLLSLNSPNCLPVYVRSICMYILRIESLIHNMIKNCSEVLISLMSFDSIFTNGIFIR